MLNVVHNNAVRDLSDALLHKKCRVFSEIDEPLDFDKTFVNGSVLYAVSFNNILFFFGNPSEKMIFISYVIVKKIKLLFFISTSCLKNFLSKKTDIPNLFCASFPNAFAWLLHVHTTNPRYPYLTTVEDVVVFSFFYSLIYMQPQPSHSIGVPQTRYTSPCAWNFTSSKKKDEFSLLARAPILHYQPKSHFTPADFPWAIDYPWLKLPHFSQAPPTHWLQATNV